MSEHHSDHHGGGNGGEHFSGFMTRERERLRADREHIFNQQEELQRKLDEINREFAAIEAYESRRPGRRRAAEAAPRARPPTTRPSRQPTRGAVEPDSRRKWSLARRDPGAHGCSRATNRAKCRFRTR